LIIAIKQEDRVVVGYTTVDTWNCFTEQDSIDPENIAIKFTPSGKLIAFALPISRADIFMYDEEFDQMASTPKSIIKDMIPYIQRKLKENRKPLRKDGSWGNSVVICDNNSIYQVTPQLHFREEGDCLTISPSNITGTIKSVLDANASLPAEEQMVKVMQLVEKVHKHIMFPLVITDTKTQQFKVIYKGE